MKDQSSSAAHSQKAVSVQLVYAVSPDRAMNRYNYIK